jgi:phosphotriesterase-related protein
MGKIQTVTGDIDSKDMGLSLVHEHVMVDFIGADKTGKGRYDADEVYRVMLPYLNEIACLGVKTFVDCTPMYLGRDPEILARLSTAAGMYILTNTGLYKEPYLPGYAFDKPIEHLVDLWVSEIVGGIEGTGIKAGFIKIAVNPGPLIPIQRKIVRAAARTHLATGATIASHTAHGVAALEELDVVEEEGAPPDSFIVVHTGSEPDQSYHFKIAGRGAWVEYDHLNHSSHGGADKNVRLIQDMLDRGYEDRLLISQDSGWYNVGQDKGGKINGYEYLMKDFLPLLRERGISEKTIHKLMVENPARAFVLDGSK